MPAGEQGTRPRRRATRHSRVTAGIGATFLLLAGFVVAGVRTDSPSSAATPSARIATAGAAAPQAFSAAASVPVFQVGTAVVNIDPPADDPQYLGGFGTMTHPTAKVHDPLEVRAFVIRRGATTVALASADSQGWFLASADGPYGIDDVRSTVAAWLHQHGSPGASAADVIVSATHSHAAPTVMGIWGPPNPRYQRQLHDATVHAIEQAASHTQAAQLWSTDADISDVIGHAVSQTDLYDGWSVDGDLPILWARNPTTGATIGLYANVPVHADIVDGGDIDAVSADHIGVARDQLDQLLGGTAVLAMGTLGRQESIVQTNGYADAERVGTYVTNRIRWALATAEPITDPTLAAATVRVQAPATGAFLLALIAARILAPGTKLPGIDNYGVDRSTAPPYLTGASIGTAVSGFRIGRLLYLTEPGEAFPDVSAALRQQVPGAQVRVIGMALDQLGYYYPAADATTTVPGFAFDTSDHFEYNASLLLAAATQHGSVKVARTLGFSSHFVQARSGQLDPTATARPGVQFFPVVPQGPSHQVLFDAAWNRAQDGAALLTGPGGPVRWDFGDGTVTRSAAVVTHTYAAPGTYHVRASVSDVQGRTSAYTVTVQVGVPAPPLPAVRGATTGDTTTTATGASTGAGTVYDVGAASRPIDPTGAQLASGQFYLGGYGLSGGQEAGALLGSGRKATGILDGVSVRALVVGDGSHALALAQVETQGWFAAYQAGPYGAEAIRRDAAAAVARLNHSGADALPASAIVVNSDHSHAGPDTVGAWGGVPTSYLKLVHDQAVVAIVAAWQARQPARLVYGTAHGGVKGRDADALIHNQLAGDPNNATVDDELRVLQARSVRTGTVVVTYLNFSAHATVLGSANTLVSADYPGVVSRDLAATYGGAGFDQVGTLGRTQPNRGNCPDASLKGAAESRCELATYANRVMVKVAQAVAHATPLTGPAVVAMQSDLIHDVATSPTLLGLLEGGSLIDAKLLRAQGPWATGPLLATATYSGRIGPLLISGSPGEPYPQIPLGVRSAVPGMRGYLSIGTAGDFLGYLVAPLSAYPGVVKAAADGNDNLLFNASLTLGTRVECSLLRGAGDVTGRGLGPWRTVPACAAFNHDVTVPPNTDLTLR